ncbi:hypothetical protein RR42_s2020 [Cupriavidus basilensis]|uniref:Uncharacterized protein n=1 Tax=Cupriavidus basilensis TaxID=68895 RepID=A0A0C4YKL8_9BURK|nr:hypothetical protein RR42_s2020 [Cupriavidus basilensis]
MRRSGLFAGWPEADGLCLCLKVRLQQCDLERLGIAAAAPRVQFF